MTRIDDKQNKKQNTEAKKISNTDPTKKEANTEWNPERICAGFFFIVCLYNYCL